MDDDAGADLRAGFLPWEFRHRATPQQWLRQRDRADRLRAEGDVELGEEVFVAADAAVFCSRLRLGDRSYIGAHAYVTGEIELGADSTINPFAVVRGHVRAGDGVRIGAHSSVLGFNHGTAPDRAVYAQPGSSLGIELGDDVWVGSNVTVLDGVRIGSHAVIGAGSVVTRDVPEWAVVVGNPARQVRDRRDPARPGSTAAGRKSAGRSAGADLDARLDVFARRARDQAPDLLARSYDGARFLDRPKATPTVRAWCDAIEICDLLLRRAPDQCDTAELVQRLRGSQDRVTGLIPEGDLADGPLDASTTDQQLSMLHGPAGYHVLCAGYALQLLGSGFQHPIHAVADLTADDLVRALDALPWSTKAWSSGHVIDCLGTACYRNIDGFNRPGPLPTLFGWLTTRMQPDSGMWGTPGPDAGWWQVVNGYYRLTRGTYAQFDIALPSPDRAVRTVLRHAGDRRWFDGDRFNACNSLDVIHPLWLLARQTDVGRDTGKRWAAEHLDKILGHWVDGAGFAFAPLASDTQPGLQGTEMWCAVIWLLADYLGHADALGYRPRGVHRPEPALPWPGLNRPASVA